MSPYTPPLEYKPEDRERYIQALLPDLVTFTQSLLMDLSAAVIYPRPDNPAQIVAVEILYPGPNASAQILEDARENGKTIFPAHTPTARYDDTLHAFEILFTELMRRQKLSYTEDDTVFTRCENYYVADAVKVSNSIRNFGLSAHTTAAHLQTAFLGCLQDERLTALARQALEERFDAVCGHQSKLRQQGIDFARDAHLKDMLAALQQVDTHVRILHDPDEDEGEGGPVPDGDEGGDKPTPRVH